MLYRVHIWGHRWPVHALDIFSLKIVVHQAGSMRTCIIVHEDEVWTNCTFEKSHMWFQYLTSLPLCIHNTTVEDVQICTSIEHYACSQEYATSTKGRFSTMSVGWNRVPHSLQIIVRQESLFKLNLDWFVNSTFLHSFKVQCWRCWLLCQWDRMCTLLDVWHRDQLSWVSGLQLSCILPPLSCCYGQISVLLWPMGDHVQASDEHHLFLGTVA